MDWRQLCMYVHRALSCHCQQQMWISTLLLSRGLQLWCETREQNVEVSFNKETKKARLPTDSCLNDSKHPRLVNCISTNPECRCDHRWLVYNYSLVLIPRVSALSVIARSWALFKSSRHVRRQSVFTKFRSAYWHCFAPCHCFASCHCCHDPFIVRSAQTRPRFADFTQPAHPSRCSRSTLTIVCFCATNFPVLSWKQMWISTKFHQSKLKLNLKLN